MNLPDADSSFRWNIYQTLPTTELSLTYSKMNSFLSPLIKSLQNLSLSWIYIYLGYEVIRNIDFIFLNLCLLYKYEMDTKWSDQESAEKKISWENVPIPDEKIQTGNEKIIYRANTVPKAQKTVTSCYCSGSHLLLKAFSGTYWWLAVGESCLPDFCFYQLTAGFSWLFSA